MTEKNIDINNIWSSYKKKPNESQRNILILHYIKLIKYTISRMTLPINTVLEQEDFINFGVLGLNDAIDKFEPERGFKFETYAVLRIKGRIQDEMRRLDWMSRSARKKANEFKAISDTINNKLEKGKSEFEALKELNISHEQYKRYLIAAADAKSAIPISDSSLKVFTEDEGEVNFLEEIPDESQDFLNDIIEDEKKKVLSKLISELKEKNRNVMILYYFENLNFKEIGQVIGVSESRISQIHSETIKDLKNKISRYEYV